MRYVVEVDGVPVHRTDDTGCAFAFVTGLVEGLSTRAWVKVGIEWGSGDVYAAFRIKSMPDGGGRIRESEVIVRKVNG